MLLHQTPKVEKFHDLLIMCLVVLVFLDPTFCSATVQMLYSFAAAAFLSLFFYEASI